MIGRFGIKLLPPFPAVCPSAAHWRGPFPAKQVLPRGGRELFAPVTIGSPPSKWTCGGVSQAPKSLTGFASPKISAGGSLGIRRADEQGSLGPIRLVPKEMALVATQ